MESNHFEKRIEFHPAYDRRHEDPNKNYGIHGVTMLWLLIGPKGAIQFVVYTGWHLPEVRDELEAKFLKNPDEVGLRIRRPMPADLGYHSPVPMYADQGMMTDDCDVLGGVCYYDGSGLQAEGVFELLVREGGDAVWNRLEEVYNLRFENERECQDIN